MPSPLPVEITARGQAVVVVATRSPFTLNVDLGDEQSIAAIEQSLHDGHPAAAVSLALLTAIDMRRQIEDLSRERADEEQRCADVAAGVVETRESLNAVQHNPQAMQLRVALTTRIWRANMQLETMTRHIVDLDVQIGERRVHMLEAVRAIDVDTARPAAP